MDDPTQASPQWYPQTGGPTGQTPPPPDDHDDDRGILGWLKDPLSLVLVLVIVVALAAAGLVGGELYARKRADDVVSSAIACIVKDQATASFGVMPPFLWQHMTGHYTNISIETAGNQVRDAKGMKVTLDIKDVRLEDSGNSGGTIGSMVGNVTWSAEGIKQTVQGLIRSSAASSPTSPPTRTTAPSPSRAPSAASRPNPPASTAGWRWRCCRSAVSGSPCPARPCSRRWTSSPVSSPRTIRWRSTCRTCRSPIQA